MRPDAFSETETAVLENHGYAICDAAMATHLPQLSKPDAPPAVSPNPRWLDETQVRAGLASSAGRAAFGRW